MTNVSEIAPAPVAPVAVRSPGDRRRPGRPEQVSQELVPLLRGTAATDIELEAELQFGNPDQLSGMRGLSFGLALSGALWVGIVYVGRWVLS